MAPVRIIDQRSALLSFLDDRRASSPAYRRDRVLSTLSASFAARRLQTRTLFPVYVDPPTSAPSSLPAACSKHSLQNSPSRPRRAAALGGARKTAPTRILSDKVLPCKENEPLRLATPSALGSKSNKPATGLGVGRKTAREALRDVSQEFECPGIEPEGFRDVVRRYLRLFLSSQLTQVLSLPLKTPPPIKLTSVPVKKGLSIFVDPSPSATAAAAARPVSKPAPLDSARPRTLTVYTSPPRKVTVVQPSSITGTVKRGRGLGGVPGLGGNVGRGLRA